VDFIELESQDLRQLLMLYCAQDFGWTRSFLPVHFLCGLLSVVDCGTCVGELSFFNVLDPSVFKKMIQFSFINFF
jgi:hypothetical protein